MAANPHDWTYRPPERRVGTPPRGGRGFIARHIRAERANDAAYWRRGVPGRRTVAFDTFGLAACWPPRWRRRSFARLPYQPAPMRRAA